MRRTRRTIPGATFGVPMAASRRRGFTIIELLIVIAIIVLLFTIAAAVGSAVARGRKAMLTENLLVALDRALDEYIVTVGAIPKYDLSMTPNPYEGHPGSSNVAEIYNGSRHMRRPDASAFIRQSRGYGEVDSIINSLPERFLVITISEGQSIGPSGSTDSDVAPSIVDTWASGDWAPPWNIEDEQVIYFVHPQNELAQDLYGRCVNNRPYFMSAGPDRKYGLVSEVAGTVPVGQQNEAALAALEDNLYSYDVGAADADMGADR